MHDQLTALGDRISLLEKQGRFFKRCAASFLAILCLVIVGGAYGFQNDNAAKLQSYLKIENLLGQERISIEHTLSGSWIILQDLQGNERVKVGADSQDRGRPRLMDANGNTTFSKNF